MPHVGIVTDASRWKTDGRFLSIEAQVDPGLPQGSRDRTGVYERERWKYEVLGFCRPNFKRRPERVQKSLTGDKKIKMTHLKPRRRHESVATLQKALEKVANLSTYEPGHFDGPTLDAFARWQRIIGYVGEDANGIPTPPAVARLGRETGVFTLDE
jgi:hypothetical protein